MKISVNQLQTCPINSEIYRDSDVSDLINSIQEVGLLQPIVVTPDNLIVSGHRRFKAIESLGWSLVECEVKEISEDELAVHIVLILTKLFLWLFEKDGINQIKEFFM